MYKTKYFLYEYRPFQQLSEGSCHRNPKGLYLILKGLYLIPKGLYIILKGLYIIPNGLYLIQGLYLILEGLNAGDMSHDG